MKENRPILRAVAFVLLQVFFLQELGFAAPDIRPVSWDPRGDDKAWARSVLPNIPASVATLEDAWKAARSPRPTTIILLQDAHTNPSGQFNLSKTLDRLLAHDKNLKHVFVEAGLDDNSLSSFRQYGARDQRKQIAERYLRSGELHGEEYLDLTSDRDFTIWGVEDIDLYRKALGDYRAVARDRERFQAYLSKIRTTIEVLKPRIYGPALSAFVGHYEKYGKGELPVTEYFEILHAFAGRTGAAISRYP
ncbi:MAG: hypothetical protein HYT89_02090, partial [Candidatus Omnitrophica bacterium]|nr:hypothetical protein [Candidatus Omnitrophota bacterium]